jgi:hypothetical protein
VRHFQPRMEGDDRYEVDDAQANSETVNVEAIYGDAKFSNDVVNQDGHLEAFDVDQAEVDRMVGVMNEKAEPAEVWIDPEAEEQTEALLRERERLRQGMHFSNFDSPVQGVRGRAPARRFQDEARYEELRQEELRHRGPGPRNSGNAAVTIGRHKKRRNEKLKVHKGKKAKRRTQKPKRKKRK